MKTIYTFIAAHDNGWNDRKNDVDSTHVEVSMSTEAKAEDARAQLIIAGYVCTPIEHREAFTNVDEAVALTTRLLG